MFERVFLCVFMFVCDGVVIFGGVLYGCWCIDCEHFVKGGAEMRVFLINLDGGRASE